MLEDEFLTAPKAHKRVAERWAPIADPHANSVAQRVLGLQRSAGNAGVTQLLRDEDEGAAVRNIVASGGQTLDPGTREQMEGAFHSDFSDVRVHTGSEATQSAQRLGAHAYTVGSDIVFSDGRYDPASESGQRTLAHELTHVVQQRSGPVDGVDNGSGVNVSDPSDRFENAAAATADHVMSGRTADGAAVEAGHLQRREDETAQGMWIQREEEPEEEEPLQGMWAQREEVPEEDEVAG
jgi:hypothetical protein